MSCAIDRSNRFVHLEPCGRKRCDERLRIAQRELIAFPRMAYQRAGDCDIRTDPDGDVRILGQNSAIRDVEGSSMIRGTKADVSQNLNNLPRDLAAIVRARYRLRTSAEGG
jgi:hypothetical protein